MAEPPVAEASDRPAILNLARDCIPGPDLLDQLVSKHVPEHVAIEYLQSNNQIQRFSYCWLHSASDALASQLALELAERSPGRCNTVIPVLIPQCPTLYVCYLAILKLGHAFCPLNLDTPPERLKFIIKDVSADIVLCVQELQDEIQCLLPEVSCIVPRTSDTSANRSYSINEWNERTPRQSSDIAYIMYTSGSTGLPKAVILPHCSVTQALLAHDEHIPSFRKFLQFASPTFDVSVFEIFFPFFRGATLACCERSHMLANLPLVMRNLDVDIAELTPSVTASLLQRRSAAPNLRHLLTIGEAMNQHTLNEFGGTPDRESMLYALYGPTEASIHCAILPKMLVSDGLQNIGKPLRTVTAIILAEDGSKSTTVSPRGVKGELALVGQLAGGYLNRQPETQAAFIHLPGYGPVYRTGDRALITEDGHICIYGRIKEGQVKIRGQRVELGEIEAAACKTKSVELAVAMMIGSSIVLFCSGHDIENEDSIRKSCNTWLPSHMRPSAIILFREGLPRLASGKIDRQQLKIRHKEFSVNPSDTRANLTETEQILIDSFSTECESSIQLSTSFVESGIDSLKAIVIASTLCNRIQGISMKMILESDNIVTLSERLSGLAALSETYEDVDKRAESCSHLAKIEHEVRTETDRLHQNCYIEAVKLCSDIQIGMLVETLRDPSANFNTVKVCLSEHITGQQFNKAFHTIISANEILRGSFVQTSSSVSPFAMVVRDCIQQAETPSLWDPLTWRHGQESGVHQIHITIHHALYDGWSWDLIMLDLNALLAKQPISQRPLYENFIQWQERQRDKFWKADVEYWANELASCPPSMLPCLCSEMPPVIKYESTELIAATKLTSLKSLAQTLRVSTQAVFQASVSLLLCSYMESTELVTGFVSSGRDAAIQGVDRVLGPCISTHPLRVNVEEVRTVRDLFVSVNRKQTLSLDHANCSLQQIKQALKLTPGQELFDVICAWQESPVELYRRSHSAYVVNTSDSIACAMLIEAEPDYKSNSVILKCKSRNDRIPFEQVNLFLRQLSTIIFAAVEDQSVTPFNIWKRFDEDTLSSCNSRPRTSDVLPNITGTVADLSITEPDRVAIELIDDIALGSRLVEKRILSYGQLHNRGRGLAARLVHEYNIQPDDIVCLCLPKSMELYIFIYAIIEAGAAYLCIDPSSPNWRINAVLQEAKCKLLVLQQEHQFSPECAVIVMRENDLRNKHDYSVSQRRNQASGRHLSYAVATSGTTGSPKIVLITRQNLFQNIIALSEIYPHQALDRLLQSCSPAFDVSVFEIFWTWHCGMTLCTASNDVLFRDMTGFINQNGITHLSMTPSVAALIDPDKISTVKVLICAGEPMSQVVDTRWRQRGLYQGYGPSETTNICTVRPVGGTQTPINNVGKPLSNTSVFICSRQNGRDAGVTLNALPPLLPLGARGEIWIGGAQVGRGYSNCLLTAQSWLDHPVHGRLYRSGDVGRLLHDGSILFTGRTDDQIKIRGLRIELKEVALAVMTTAHVDNACCLKLSIHAKEELVCFCTTKFTISADSSIVHKIFENVSQRLPSYMVPDLIVPISEFPMTTQGKIDSMRLVDVHSDISQVQRAKYGRFNVGDRHTTKMTEHEMAIAEVVAGVVDVPIEHIDATASFFAMGIDSIRAITLTNLLRGKGLGHIEISAVLRHASVSKLALHLQNNGRANRVHKNDTSLLSRFSRSWRDSLSMKFSGLGYKIENMLPCTSLQSAMLASTTAVHSKNYWNILVYSFKVPVDVLRNAWSIIVRRHAIFRTAFVIGESLNEPYCQMVLHDFELPWRRSQAFTIEDANTTDVLSGQPPYELVLTADNLLHLRIHHAMYDAVALDIVHAEIETICHQRELQSTVSFTSYLHFMTRTHQNDLNDFWDHKFRHQKSFCLMSKDALHQSGRTTQLRRVAKLPLRIIEDQARSSRVTTLAILQAALSRLLNACFGTQQCCFGTVFSGRNTDIEGAEKIVGPCFNTLPTLVPCDQGRSNRELCRELHQFNLDVLPYQATSLSLLTRQYGAGARALFDCLLLFQPPPTKLDPNVLSLVSEEGTMDFPLIFEVIPSIDNDELKLALHCQLESVDIALRLLSLFEESIEEFVLYPESSSRSIANIDSLLADFFHLPESQSHIPSVTHEDHQAEELDQRTQNAGKSIIDIVNILRQEEPRILDLSWSIFQLGLDSINAIQLVQALRDRGYKISLADVLEHPHLRDIAKICSSMDTRVERESATFDLIAFEERWRPHLINHFDLRSADVEAVWPCTPIQSGIISQTIDSQYKLYFSTILLRLENNVDVARLRDAWQHNMQRHAMLRTGFSDTSNSTYPYAMIVYKQQSLELPWQKVVEEDMHLNGIDQWPAEVFAHGKPPWRVSVVNTEGHQALRLQIHHALYDARSLQKIFQDIVLLYRNSILPPITPVTAALRQIIGMSQNSNNVDDFYEILKDQAEVTMFPNFNPGYFSDSGFVVEQRSLSFSAQTISEGCKKLDCSFLALCQASWAELLKDYLGQECVSFGNVVSDRVFDDTILNDVAFPCINTYPVCVQIAADRASTLSQLQMINAASSRCQHARQSPLLRKLEADGPLFDTVLALQHEADQFCANELWQVIEEEANAEYSVSMEVLRKKDGVLELRITARSGIMPRDQAVILLAQFENVMCNILRFQYDPGNQSKFDTQLLCILPASEAKIQCTATTLHDLFLVSAEKCPNSTAFEFATSSSLEGIELQNWTYEQLKKKSYQVANLLVSSGAQTGDLVAVCFDKCPEASFALLGVQAAGCGYVAIDPAAPQARKDFILKDAHCKILLATSLSMWDISDRPELQILLLDSNRILSDMPDIAPSLSRPVLSRDICYCLYTSGTTGQPKGCLIPHVSSVQAMLSFQRIFAGRWDENSRWLQFAGFHFDVSVLEHFWSWSVGICVTSISRDLLFEDFGGTINALQITHLDLTPSLARLISPQDVPKLCKGVFIVGGEQVRQDIYDAWASTGCLYNFYGPSEVTIGCTFRQVTTNANPSNIGYQWDNVSTLVLKPHSEEVVPRGGIGELCLGGILVGDGYLNRPELTAQKFVTLRAFSERVYRTGDLVRLLYDNSFQFLGRIDDQVKLRGQRLEIGEINHVLIQSNPSIRDVTTLVISHPEHGTEQLVAFFAIVEGKPPVVTQPQVQLDGQWSELSDAARDFAAQRLPGYMIPAHFIVLDHFPLTLNNKIDSKALRTLYQNISFSSLHKSTSPPKNQAQQSRTWQKLATTISTYTGITQEGIRPSTSVFELGIDSVSAVGLARMLKKSGFSNVSVGHLLKYRSLQDLLGFLEQTKDDTALPRVNKPLHETMESKLSDEFDYAAVQQLHVVPDDIEAVVPCTPLQEGMITKLIMDDSMKPPYLARFDFELEPTVDIEHLASAWKDAAVKLGILRTRFVLTTMGIAQVILRPIAAVAPIISERDIRKAFEEFVASARKFGCESPWQVCFSPMEKGKHRHMAVFAFHGIYDAISLPLLLDTVHDLYTDSTANVSNVPQFHDIIRDGYFISGKDEAKFWQQHLDSIKLLGLPNSLEPGTEMCNVKTRIDLPHSFNICSSLKVTISAVFHASWLLTLARAFSCNPTIGVVVSGRMSETDGADRVVGPMFNTLPRNVTALNSGTTFADLIGLCHEKNVETISRQHTSLSQIRRWLSVPTDHSLFDSLFVFQKDSDTRSENSLWTIKGSSTIADYPLNVEIEQEKHHRFQVSIGMANGDYNLADAETLLREFTGTLTNLHDLLGDLLPPCFAPSEDRDLDVGSNLRSNFEPAEDLASGWSQRAIGRIVADLAGVDGMQVNLDSPTIFELGLDSVDALKIAARLRAEGMTIPVSKIIKYPTVAGINRHAIVHGDNTNDIFINTSLDSNVDEIIELATDEGIDMHDGDVVLYVTPMQAGLLVNYDKYYYSLVYQIHDGVSSDRLSDALRRVVECSPALRTSFAALDASRSSEAYLQVVESSSRASIQVYNMKDDAKLETCVRNIRDSGSSEGSRPVIAIVNIANSPSYWVLAIHHALYDGMSISLLHQNIQRAYYGEAIQSAPLMPTKEYIKDARAATTDIGNNNFWAAQVQGILPSLIGPVDSDSAGAQARLLYRASRIPIASIRKVCKRHGITIQSIGLACWSLTLAQLMRQLDVCFGLVTSGRTTTETQELLFPTFNTVIFRPQIQPKTRKLKFLTQIHNLATEIYEHQLFPLSQAGILANRPASKLFNTLFTFQRRPIADGGLKSIYHEWRSTNEAFHPPYAFNLEMEEVDHTLQWTIAVQSALMSADKIHNIFDMLDLILERLVQEEDVEVVQPISDKTSVCGMEAFEARAILHQSHDSELEARRPSSYSTAEQCVREIFAELSGADIDKVTKSTTLFNVGLDSISSMKVSNLLRKAGWKVPVSKILERQSVAGIADAAEKIHSDGNAVGTSIERPVLDFPAEQGVRNRLTSHEVEDSDIEVVLPASGGQEYMLRMWRASQSRLFYSTFWFEVQKCDEKRLQHALEQLVKVIPALRTRFIQHDQQFYQIILKAGSRLQNAMPWSYHTKRLGDKLLLSLDIHHALYDGVSLEMIMQLLATLCVDDIAQSKLVAITDQRAFLSATTILIPDEKQRQKDFWTRYIGKGQMPKSETGSFEVPRTESFVSDLTFVQPLLGRLREEGVSLQAAFFTVASRQLAKTMHVHQDGLKGSRSVWIGIYLSNRTLDIADMSVLTFPTFNIVPLKVEVDGDMFIASRQAQQDIIEVSKAGHCGVSLREIYMWTGLKLDCYINFLRLPKNNEVAGMRSGERVEIKHAQGGSRVLAQDLQASRKVSPLIEEGTTDAENLEWCLPAMDIEARVDNDGKLGVGVFVPSDMVSAEGAERYIQGLKMELEQVAA